MSISQTKLDELIIVSGLPRSGTSMMMRMLESGGIAPVTDNLRTADEDNPAGYYEYEPVKRTKQDPSWIPPARGKAVKMVYQLVYDMPPSYQYKILCMRRDMQEMLQSQRKMLERSGRDAGPLDDRQMADLFAKALTQFEHWTADQPNVQMMTVSFNEIQLHPRRELERINTFLDDRLNVDAMVNVLDGRLYRNRRS